MRLLLVDPASFTPQYDHALASALVRAGVDVELLTSRFRFGEPPRPEGYMRSEIFYPLSNRLFGRSRARLPLKATEHAVGLIRIRSRRASVVHHQWLAAPEIDNRVLRMLRPTVFTAHDLLPRRTARRRELWTKLLRRFSHVVVHSEHGREALGELGVDPECLTVIPHPVFPSDPPRQDDGATVLALGVIRPYKGLGDTIAALERVPEARLLVVGDPVEPVEAYQAAAGSSAEWRLGYAGEAEVDRALGESTIAVFPYRPEIDQSGALLRALGAGVPVVAYDVGGMAEPVRRFEAGRVVDAGDVEALSEAIRGLLSDREELDRARAGARRARETLTWDASAAAHVELYGKLV
ncbi:MAG TPA: glycosyltransferase family 4 protein [Gaiellaceae bacterium]